MHNQAVRGPSVVAELELLAHLSAAAATLLFSDARDSTAAQSREQGCVILKVLLQHPHLQAMQSSLASYQRQQGFSRCLTAHQLHCLQLLLIRETLVQLAAAGDVVPQARLQQLEAASRRLCREQPDSPASTYQLATALLLQRKDEAALAMFRVAARLAHTRKGEPALVA